jgi:transposase
MAAISADLRLRIFEARQAGESTQEVAERFAVSPAFVRRLLQRHRETGSLAPKDTRRGRKPLLAAHAEAIRELIGQQPDLTAAEVRGRLGLAASVLTVWRTLRRLGLTFKKSRSGPLSRTVRMWLPLAASGPPSSPPSRRGG